MFNNKDLNNQTSSISNGTIYRDRKYNNNKKVEKTNHRLPKTVYYNPVTGGFSH